MQDIPIQLADMREHLAPAQNAYTVSLLVGADDGAARAFDVDGKWAGHATDPNAALRSIQLAVRRS